VVVSPVRESRRFAFPPLWLVPLLLMGAILAITFASLTTLSSFGFVVAAYAVWRLESWADAYVRGRNAARD
jgi:hypothetical protein